MPTDKTKTAKPAASPAPKVSVKLTAVVTHGDKERHPGAKIDCSKEVAEFLIKRDKAVAL